MRHATDRDLDRIEPLLRELRGITGLSERKRGIFYWKSRAYLHFHEHAGALYADVRLGSGDFDRFALDSTAASRKLLDAVRAQVATPP